MSISSPARFRGLDAVATAPRLRVPVLYVAAEDDDNAGYDFSKDAEAMPAASGSTDKSLELLPGGLHGVGLVAGSAQAKALIETFLREQ